MNTGIKLYNTLLKDIKLHFRQRQGKATTNFEFTLPPIQSALAREMLKDINKPIGISEYELTRILPDKLKINLPSVQEIEEELSEKLNLNSAKLENTK